MAAELQQLTAQIAAAYAANNGVEAQDLYSLIRGIYSALDRLGKEAPVKPAPAVQQRPAVPIKRSVAPDYVVCLECGKQQKMLKRHLASEHGTTPNEYRAKWRLPHEYPMTAPTYAEARSQFAKSIGLGRKAEQRNGRRK